MNPTSERLWVPEGTILGWVEEEPEIFTVQEVLQQQMSNHAGEVGDEQAAEIHVVLDAIGKARSEAISHEPAFDPPDHHPMHGKLGDEMVKWVLQHEAEEMRAWRPKHGEKLRLGKNLQAEET